MHSQNSWNHWRLQSRRVSLFIYYAIFCEDKNTSKIRTIFEDPSFNNCFYKGPQLGPLLFYILHHLRTYPVALTSDIEKPFLKINSEPMERNYLRFSLYDVCPDFPKPKRLRFARVIFGVTISPFLLNGTIRKHVCIIQIWRKHL